MKCLLFDPAPQTVIFFYKIFQPEYEEMRKDDSSIYFINELPQNINSFKALVSPHSHNGCLVIFDDYELEVSENISFFLSDLDCSQPPLEFHTNSSFAQLVCQGTEDNLS